MKTLLTSLLFAAGALPAAALGATVQVNFIQPERYTDVDRFSDESRQAMHTIERTLIQLGNRHLPSDAVLRVDVLDVDLAGRLVPSPQRGRDIRVARGLADPPSLRLHYVLERGGRVLRENEDTLHGLDYLSRSNIQTSGEAFPYEQQLLTRWFRGAFAAP